MAALGALVALLVAYAAQVATPLRLVGPDSVIYLTMARSIATGDGIPPGSVFPPGLPSLYAVLDIAGLGTSWAIVACNVLFAVVAVVCTIYLYRRVFEIPPQASVLLGCAALLSYVLVKHAALALSDVPFLGVSSAALVFLTIGARDGSRRRWGALALGIVLVAAAITIRTAGVALVPAALLAVANAARAGTPFGRWLRRPGAAFSVVFCAGACAGLAIVLSGSRYVDDASAAYGNGPGRTASLLTTHVRNWGEIGLNAPATRLPHALHPMLLPAGLVVLAALAAGLWRQRRAAEPVHAFVISYLILIFAWPFVDARFWLPLVPLAIGYAFVGLQPLLRHRAAKAALAAYTAVFVSLGIAALAYDTRLSYSGARFPDRFGSDVAGETLQPTYRVAFGEPRPGDAALVDPAALAVLRHFEARARPGRP